MKERKRDVDRRKAWSNANRAKEAKASTQRKQASRQRIAAAGKHPDVDKSAANCQHSKVQHRLAKLLQRLQRSPMMWVVVINHLAVSSKVMPNPSKEIQRVRHTPINVEAIEAFYSRHDISREAPGMKDTVTVRTVGIKEIKRKRHLMYKLREVYAMFCEEHGTIVGFSTFCNLRPVNVLLSQSTPHDMCLY